LNNAGNRDGGRERMDRKPRQYVQSLDRALDIIEELAKSGDSLKVTELSEKLALHKSTVHRLLATLLYRGYAEQNENGRYKVGLKLFEIAGNVLNKMDLRKRVKPFLVKLQQETSETIHLAILDGKDVVYIDKEETSEIIRMHSEIGSRVDAYCTSLGKVLLAYKDVDIYHLYAEEDLEKHTANTIIDKELLAEHLALVKRQGYAIDDEEQEPGIRCIGGPIFDYTGEVIAAFSIAGPINRMTEERVRSLTSIVLNYSRLISSSFGYIAENTSREFT
jgi:DNA-binding IclR family transcriptional regulator